MLENCSSEQLLGIFASCLNKESRKIPNDQLPEAWGTLFSHLFLSADEMVDEMQRGENRMSEDIIHLLRSFIKMDCESGGYFALNIIKKGGKTDRAALIMIADLESIAALEYDGTTAIHQLTEACDKRMRPALIGRAGKRLLSRVFDSRGLPVLFTLFSLNDLCMQDLAAVSKVFSKDELRVVMNKNRTGKNALKVFIEILPRLKNHPPGERNKFLVTNAVKSTNTEGSIRSQVNFHGHHDGASGAQVQPSPGKKVEPDPCGFTSDSERYEFLMPGSRDEIGTMIKKTLNTK